MICPQAKTSINILAIPAIWSHLKLELILPHLNRLQFRWSLRPRQGQMFLRKVLMIREPLYLTRSAPAQLVSMAMTVPLISKGEKKILTVRHRLFAAVLMVANGTRSVSIVNTGSLLCIYCWIMRRSVPITANPGIINAVKPTANFLLNASAT